jgi:predicted permease
MGAMFTLDALRIDTRHSLRRLRQTPGLTVTVVVTIVLVLTANVTIFSLLDAIQLRKVSVTSPDELVAISATDARTNQPGYFYAETVQAYRSAQTSFTQLAMYNGGGVLRVEPQDGVVIDTGVEAISADYFALVQVYPAAGRLLTKEDDSGPPTVVLSHRLAERLFGEPSKAVAKKLAISGRPITVVGVVERGFTGLAFDSGADLFVSFATLRGILTNPNPAIRSPYLIGRLASGISLGEARAELVARWPAIQTASIDSVPAGVRAAVLAQRVQLDSVATGFSGLRRQYGASLIVLMALAVVLLAVGVINLSGLLLARGLSRNHQFVVQRALGATGSRLMQQSLLDGLFLAFAGLSCALPIAWWLTRRFTPMLMARALPLQQTLAPTMSVFVVATAITIVIGLLIAALPARHGMIVRAADVLRGGRSIPRTLGLVGRGVIVTQVALAMVLVSGAGLFVATLTNLYANDDSSARTTPILWTRLAQNSGLRGNPTETYLRALVDQLSQIRGADAAALSSLYPAYLGFPGVMTNTTIAPASAGDPVSVVTGITEFVTPGFFELFGIARSRGRDFTWADNANSGAIAIISESVAARLFPSSDPIGQELQTTTAGATTRVVVVGVVANAPIGRIDEPEVPVVFRPISQNLSQAVVPLAHVRVAGDLAEAREGYVNAVTPLGRHNVRALFTMDDWVDGALLQQRLVASVATSAAAIALLLAAIGICGVLAYSVTTRVREIGIRMSVGATQASIARMVVREGMVMVIAGVAVGLPSSLVAATLVRAQLYGVSAGDPRLIVGAIMLFVVASMIAASLPALRACRIHPMEALRRE